MQSKSRLMELRAIERESGLCWCASLPLDAPAGDRPGLHEISTLRLFEGELELGPAHALHDDIRRQGGGLFSHWGGSLYFSTSDGSSPLENGLRYTALVEGAAAEKWRQRLAAAAQVDMSVLTPEERYRWGERLFELFVPDAKLAEFGRSFYRDTDFLADYERFDRENYHSLDRKYALKELFKLVLTLDGDVAECGVFRGASAFLMAKDLLNQGSGKTLHLFDSFSGLSKPAALDGRYWTAGALACSLPEVQANLAEVAGVVRFHPGWIPERFGDIADRRFCFVHIDVDLFQPTRDSLEFFYPRLVPGGILLCDDYGFDTCPGARRAVDEFFASKLEPVIHLPTGQGFVVRRTA